MRDHAFWREQQRQSVAGFAGVRERPMKSIQQAALEFAEKRLDSKNLEMREAAGKILGEELGRLVREGFVHATKDELDGVVTYGLTGVGLMKLQQERAGAQQMQLTPAGQTVLEQMLAQLTQLNALMIQMNNELVNIREGIYHGKEAIPQSPEQRAAAARQATQARADHGPGDGSAAAHQ